MKRILPVLLLNFFLSQLLCAQMPVPAKPAVSEGLVLDYTRNTLSATQRSQLNEKLIAYDDSTSTQIAVVIMSTTGIYPIEDVALQILRQWGVGGQAKKDNGVVILVAKDDRKVRIETGYGMEGAIPDMIAASIIDDQMVPYFRQGDYYGGLEAGTDAIIRAAAGEYTAPEGYGEDGKKDGDGWIIVVIVIIVIIILGRISGGKGGGGYVSRRGYRGFSGPIFPGGGGWFGGGGGGGWSGGGGGGFGGFGGGSGGGGGASGSW